MRMNAKENIENWSKNDIRLFAWEYNINDQHNQRAAHTYDGCKSALGSSETQQQAGTDTVSPAASTVIHQQLRMCLCAGSYK